MLEVWKPVVGYEGFYLVSNQGRVKSLSRLVSHWRGGTRPSPGRILKPGKLSNGRWGVRLSRKQGQIKSRGLPIL